MISAAEKCNVCLAASMWLFGVITEYTIFFNLAAGMLLGTGLGIWIISRMEHKRRMKELEYESQEGDRRWERIQEALSRVESVRSELSKQDMSGMQEQQDPQKPEERSESKPAFDPLVHAGRLSRWQGIQS